ncbi:MAG: amidohydrolase family protein [Bacteroidia bacterium]
MRKNSAKSKWAAMGLAVALLAGCMGKRCPHEPLAKEHPVTGKYVIHDVRLFDGVDTVLREHQNVWIEDGKIVSITSANEILPDGIKMIDFKGQDVTLLPGFVDAHVHLTASGSVPWAPVRGDVRQNAATCLDAGITTVYDLGGMANKLEAADQKIAAGKWRGPKIYHTHSPITTPGGHPIPAIQALLPKAAAGMVLKLIPQVGKPEEAGAALDKVMKEGVDYIKVICDSFSPGLPEMGEDVLRALVEESHKRGQRVFVHIGSAANALSAVRCEADVLAHGPFRSRLTPEQAGIIGGSGIPMIYTYAACKGAAEITDGRLQPDELDHRYTEDCILGPATGTQGKQFGEAPVLGGFGHEVLKHAPYQQENVRLLHVAGQRFLIGTDSPLPGAYVGSGFHHEMELLHAAGIPTGEVLLGATCWAAKALLDKPDFGTVAPGMRADLVIIHGNPIQDIRATRDLQMVIQNGRVYELTSSSK